MKFQIELVVETIIIITFILSINFSKCSLIIVPSRPIIEDLNNGCTVEGDDIVLECKKTATARYVSWGFSKTPRNITSISPSKKQLTVHNATLKDAGPYYCFQDGNSVQASKRVKIHKVSTIAESLSQPNKPSAYIEANCSSKTSCRDFKCVSFANSEPNISWFFKPCPDFTCTFTSVNGTNIIKNGLYQSISSIHIDISKSGYLKCIVNNANGKSEALQEIAPFNNTGQRFLDLKERSFKYQILPEKEQLELVWRIMVHGLPKPSLSLMVNNETLNETLSFKYRFSITRNEIHVKIKNASEEDLNSQFELIAKNIFEVRTLNLTFNVSDPPKTRIEVDFLNSTCSVVKCVAVSIVRPNISWCFKPCFEQKCTYNSLRETYFERTNLQLTSYLEINSSMFGYLNCSSRNLIGAAKVVQKVADVRNGLDIFGSDQITKGTENIMKIEIKPFRKITLTCGASAYNHTDVKWSWPNMENVTYDYFYSNVVTNDTVFSIQQTITLSNFGDYSRPFITGIYNCSAWTSNGTLEIKQIKVSYKVTEGKIRWSYYAVAILLAIVLIVAVLVTVKMRNYQKLQKQIHELNILTLDNFEKGALEHVNPNLPIDDQANLLPYDQRYEFPVDKLKLGKQIGSGAFGVVVKAEAESVTNGEKSTTVAVKMVNRNIGDTHIKALASELKIMIHLGKHLNVVNLIGACTKNLMKRELLVLVEYCRFGNVKDYLLNHRHTFINQINNETGQIDYTIECNTLSQNEDADVSYAIISFPNDNNEASVSDSTSPFKKDKNHDSAYQGDYKDITKPISTRDLLEWSFQVAKGMDYLSSRKVLHGDLAARNILLTDGNVVKICDFGLSRNMDQKDIYKKTGDEMLPVKWMAIESITDKIFSIQSDVWSFGVVLWEFFSLAKTPYPGIEYNEQFCEKLLDGYRMKAPEFATQEIYDIMLKCWNTDPTIRPSFKQLVHKIGSILDERIRNYYIEMNSGYIKMNAQNFVDSDTDYLSMMNAPNFQNFPSSHTNPATSNIENRESYL